MGKWNPFEKHILKADSDEFAGEQDAGYGIPHDADSSGNDPAGSGSGDPADRSSGSGAEGLSRDPEHASVGAGSGMGGAEEMPGGNGTHRDSAEQMPGSTGNGMGGAEQMPGGGDSFSPDQENHRGEDTTIRQDTGAGSEDAFSGQQTGDSKEPSMGGPAAGASGFGAKHDFEDDELKFDTQTGERLDVPKKKFPAMLLTLIVSAVAVGAFIYSVYPGALPSRENRSGKERETEIRLAIAPSESEKEKKETKETKTDAPALQPDPAGDTAGQSEKQKQTEGAVILPSGSGKQTEKKTGTQTQPQTETEPESGTEAARADGIPQFKTEGITVSASLDVADLVEEVMPGVVSVTATSVQTVRDFFYGLKEIRQTDAGSGIIVDRDDNCLYIVTDAGIVDGAQDVTVGFCVEKDQTKTLSNEDTVASAELIGVDQDALLAVIRVPVSGVNETVLKAVRTSALGDSDTIRTGDRVLAIGNAMGRGLSVTQGIISAVDREMRYGSSVRHFIQTDASINYGNYGGALLNEEGEVIGINEGKITSNAGEGMGFAVPVNDAKALIETMTGKGETAADTSSGKESETGRAQGMTEQKDQKETLALALAEPESGGMEPAEENAAKTTEEKPEEETAEAAGDTAAEEKTEGSATQQVEDKTSEKAQEKASEKAQEKASEQEEGTGKAPAVSGGGESASSGGQLGIQVGEFSKEDQIIYRIPAGVVIAEVVSGSGAQTAGLLPGDLITGINEIRVNSVAELKEALQGLKPGDRVRVSYIRPDENSSYKSENEMNVTVTLQ